jgi:beta-galactosidase
VKNAGVAEPDQDLPATVHAKHGVNQAGKRVDYYLNYSSDPQQFPYGGQRCRSADAGIGSATAKK